MVFLHRIKYSTLKIVYYIEYLLIIKNIIFLFKTNLKNDKVLSEKFAHILTANTEVKSKKNASQVKTATTHNSNRKSKVTFNLSNVEKSDKMEEESCTESEDDFDEEDDNTNDSQFSTEPDTNIELTDEFNDDTDEDNNIVIQKEKKIKIKKSILKKTKSKPKHCLSDLIHFDDVEDDFFPELDEELAKTSKTSAKKSPVEGSKKKRAVAKEKMDDELDDYEDLGANLDSNSESSSTHSNDLIDDDTKTEAFRHIIAGACMSMGLKFAGSCNKEAYETLVYNLNMFHLAGYIYQFPVLCQF